ncbi:MAG: hypothetical protein IT364_22000 [Candidatus Hydrogenedentes bacterium]|nr:hypothetical protein [Candidatus Hydrogenedentota bacterium]
MRRVFTLVIAVLVCFSLVGCGSKKKVDDPEKAKTSHTYRGGAKSKQ